MDFFGGGLRSTLFWGGRRFQGTVSKLTLEAHGDEILIEDME